MVGALSCLHLWFVVYMLHVGGSNPAAATHIYNDFGACALLYTLTLFPTRSMSLG